MTDGRQTHIYGLLRKVDTFPRYIGKTYRLLKDRLWQHRNAARAARLPIHRWLQKHEDIQIVLLETVPADMDWALREIAWIERGRREGWGLLNLTKGGEGLAGLVFSKEHRAKQAAAARKGAFFSCRTCSALFWRKPSAIAKGQNKYCSRYCCSLGKIGVSNPPPRSTVEKAVAGAAAYQKAKTHCPKGHPYSGTNLYINCRGARSCRECLNTYKREKRRLLKNVVA